MVTPQMKKAVLGAVLIACLMVVVDCGSGSKYYGVYRNQKDPNICIELRPDGTAVLVLDPGPQAARSLSMPLGAYEISGDSITFEYGIGIDSAGNTKTIKDNTIIDGDGNRWIKK